MKSFLSLVFLGAVTLLSGAAFAFDPTPASTADTIALLRAGNWTGNKTLYLRGFNSVGDGGGGEFQLSATDHNSADNGCTIIVDATGNRFYRQVSGALPITTCGASASAADNTTAIQNAANTGLPIAIPSGRFVANGPVILSTAGQKINGPGTLATPTTWNPTTNSGVTSFGTRHVLFFLTAAAANVTFQDLKFDGSSTTSTSATTPSYQPTFITSLAQYTSFVGDYFHALPTRTKAPLSGVFVNFAQAGSSTADGGLVSACIFDNAANGIAQTATFGGGAVYFGSSEGTVTGSEFFNANDTEVTIDSTGVTPANKGLVVSGNLFDGGTYGVQGAFGALTIQSGSYGVTFSGNYVRSISQAVLAQDSGLNAQKQGLTISGNVFDMSNGAFSAYSDYTGSSYAEIENVSIVGNQVTNLSSTATCQFLCAAFVISGAGYNVENNVISGSDSTSGILIRQYGTSVPVDIKISNNKFFTNEASAGGSGINIPSGTEVARLRIESNECYGSGNAANACVNFQGAGPFLVELRNNEALSQGTKVNYGNLYAGTPWGTFAYNALPGSHYLNSNIQGYLIGSSLIPGTAAPTSGNWRVGDTVYNTIPAETGTSGSKYIISGWINTVAGSPGTWLPQRTLTGN